MSRDHRPRRPCPSCGAVRLAHAGDLCRACYRTARRGDHQGGPHHYAERFWARVDRSNGFFGCWPWLGPINKSGYGDCRAVGEYGAHRVAYRLAVGPIPEGLTLDHLCHNRARDCAGGITCPHRRCVNPIHLEPATLGDNVLRGNSPAARFAARTHCSRGHEYTPENTSIRAQFRGSRRCLTCQAEWNLITNAKYRRVREVRRVAL